MMMAGFGDPVKKKKKPAGVGRGQEAYQRQMKSFNGLVGAGAEGVDVYVHREVSDLDGTYHRAALSTLRACSPATADELLLLYADVLVTSLSLASLSL